LTNIAPPVILFLNYIIILKAYTIYLDVPGKCVYGPPNNETCKINCCSYPYVVSFDEYNNYEFLDLEPIGYYPDPTEIVGGRCGTPPEEACSTQICNDFPFTNITNLLCDMPCNEMSNWEQKTENGIEIADCPGCKVNITYKYRSPTVGSQCQPEYYDLQLIKVEPTNSNCNGCYSNFSGLYGVALGWMLMNAAQRYLPYGDCFEYFRVINTSCWGEFIEILSLILVGLNFVVILYIECVIYQIFNRY